jgi:hypothetical protein
MPRGGIAVTWGYLSGSVARVELLQGRRQILPWLSETLPGPSGALVYAARLADGSLP